MGNVLPEVVPATEQHVNDALGWMQLRGLSVTPADVFSTSGFVVCRVGEFKPSCVLKVLARNLRR